MPTVFDEKLESLEKSFRAESFPQFSEVREASGFVVDTLDIAWSAAKSLFGDKATPDHAIEIYDRMILRIEAVQAQESDDEEFSDEDEYEED
ncbi:hypothetical protein KA183_08170 [bacterium]|nr:hypothetical protein [bacterium]QQR58437.1 MAG: hypothetical protein IPG59_02770 [Candidatus Melainabacteria bacterium]